MKLREIDWDDVQGIILVYWFVVGSVFCLLYRDNDIQLSFWLVIMMLPLTFLIAGWEKFRWGRLASFWLILIVFAILFTPFYAFYQSYIKPRLGHRAYKKGG